MRGCRSSSRASGPRHATPRRETRTTVEIAERWRYPATPMSPGPTAAVRRAIASLGGEPVELPSGAGHDAQILGMAGVPVGMLFVRSDAGGVSHAPEEWTEDDALVACVRALEPALRELLAAATPA